MNINRFWNIAPRNPTQTRLRRFMKMPGNEIQTTFSKKMTDFQNTMDRGVETSIDWMFDDPVSPGRRMP